MPLRTSEVPITPSSGIPHDEHDSLCSGEAPYNYEYFRQTPRVVDVVGVLAFLHLMLLYRLYIVPCVLTHLLPLSLLPYIPRNQLLLPDHK